MIVNACAMWMMVDTTDVCEIVVMYNSIMYRTAKH
jgi:hypothetical protein